jgi:multimeric flavodoxin WrbA
MRIVGICGSPKKEKSNTRFLLQKSLEVASDVLSDGETKTATTLLLQLSDFEIRHCTGCDSCVRKKPCPVSAHDDMAKIEDKLLQADGISLQLHHTSRLFPAS